VGYIKEVEDANSLLAEISSRSKMNGVSREFTALDKAEEELIECLMEVRKLKSHYNEIKVTRKELTKETKNKAIEALIEEMGDIYVDVFIGIPSVIPEISYPAINKRIKYKLNKYMKVIDKLNQGYTIKKSYEAEIAAIEGPSYTAHERNIVPIINGRRTDNEDQ
jgi:hypothetical protein